MIVCFVAVARFSAFKIGYASMRGGWYVRKQCIVLEVDDIQPYCTGLLILRFSTQNIK